MYIGHWLNQVVVVHSRSCTSPNGTYRDLTDEERIVFKNISQGLNAVLDPSNERNRSILPQDLKTAVRFVDVVAE